MTPQRHCDQCNTPRAAEWRWVTYHEMREVPRHLDRRRYFCDGVCLKTWVEMQPSGNAERLSDLYSNGG